MVFLCIEGLMLCPRSQQLAWQVQCYHSQQNWLPELQIHKAGCVLLQFSYCSSWIISTCGRSSGLCNELFGKKKRRKKKEEAPTCKPPITPFLLCKVLAWLSFKGEVHSKWKLVDSKTFLEHHSKLVLQHSHILNCKKKQKHKIAP